MLCNARSMIVFSDDRIWTIANSEIERCPHPLPMNAGVVAPIGGRDLMKNPSYTVLSPVIGADHV